MTFQRPRARDYIEAYQSGETTPLDVAERTLRAIETIDSGAQPIGAFVELQRDVVLELARESTARWQNGTTRGPLDGVPVAIKDEFDMQGFRTRAGTSFKGRSAAVTDSTAVQRLREAGATLLGKTHMTELGLGGTGLNPNFPAPRNPYDPSRMTGGSSSGSAAIVSSGVCPIALGSDAGGSIRMPAALCGIYGLKATYGRIPTTGGRLLSWSLDHLGPLAASVQDLALFYDITAGDDGIDPMCRASPSPEILGEWPIGAVEGKRFAWCPKLGDDADAPVRQAFHAALGRLVNAGAIVEEVDLPWADEIRKVGYVTFVVEAAAGQREWLAEHRRDYNLDTRMLLAVGEKVSAVEYLHAQRIRTLIRDGFAQICRDYDAFLNPTLACTAPVIVGDDQEPVIDTAINAGLARYTFAGTLTGFPALSIPCGAVDGLPVGLQLTASPWADADLLRLAASVDAEMPRLASPQVWVDPLRDSS